MYPGSLKPDDLISSRSRFTTVSKSPGEANSFEQIPIVPSLHLFWQPAKRELPLSLDECSHSESVLRKWDLGNQLAPIGCHLSDWKKTLRDRGLVSLKLVNCLRVSDHIAWS